MWALAGLALGAQVLAVERESRAPVASAGRAEGRARRGSGSGTDATSEMKEGDWHLRKTRGYQVEQRRGEHTDLLGSLSQAEVSKPLLPPSPVPPGPLQPCPPPASPEPDQGRAAQPGPVRRSQMLPGDSHVHLHVVCIPVKGGIHLPAPGVGSWNCSTPKTRQVCGCWEGGQEREMVFIY